MKGEMTNWKPHSRVCLMVCAAGNQKLENTVTSFTSTLEKDTIPRVAAKADANQKALVIMSITETHAWTSNISKAAAYNARRKKESQAPI